MSAKVRRRISVLPARGVPPPPKFNAEPPQSNAEPMEVDEVIEEPNISDDEEGGTRIGDIYIPPPIKPYCSTESKGPRLMITKIENVNFKSYAGKVILGPFHHCFTAIIGPNGSGKSNVIDSMLFVFGYRAQKIRCKKLSVLLHNSAKYPNMQMCSVAVHFKQILDRDNGGCDQIPNTEIVIARTAFRDNSSHYTVNGRRVQFKEVSKLLKEHGVDLDHNRFLILQGEVESIAMMKSKAQSENECGMLEYLEDIVGTTRYKEPLIKINARVEKLTEERTEKHNRCKLAEREMKDLEQPYNEAVDYLKLENSLTRAKNLQIQKYLSEQHKKLQGFTTEKESVDAEMKEHDEEYAKLKEERLQKEAIIKEEIAQYEKLCKNKEEMEQTLKKALNSFTEVQAIMAATNKRRKQNKEQLEKLKEKLVECKKLPEKNQQEIKDCEKKIDQLTKQKSELEETLQSNYAELKNKTNPLIEEKDVLQVKLGDLKKDVDESNACLKIVETELSILKSGETTEKRKYESMKSSYEDSKKILEEKLAQAEECNQTIPLVKQEIASKMQTLEKLKSEEDILNKQYFELKNEVAEKKQRVDAVRSHNKVIDSLMKQKLSGKVPGILGRLGDLGAINKKYDVAISTSCGRLDNVVVDTIDTAQACIEHLKKYNLGRSTFIALEKQNHLWKFCNSKIMTPENVFRLFDLVEVEDEQVRPAFYMALRNTLVANDLDQASRVSYDGPKRFRVVTLNGNIIELSGTMAGGGNQPIRGKMGEKVATKTNVTANTSVSSEKDLETLQIQIQDLKSRISYLQEEQGRLEREINQLKHSLIRKEKEINKFQVTVGSLQQQLPAIEAQLKAQKTRVDQTFSDPEKVKSLEKEIEIKREACEKSQNATSTITDKIKEISKKITSIHGDKIKPVQQKIDNIGKQIKKLNSQILKLNVEMTTSERNYKKTEEDIANLIKDIKTAEDSIKSLSEERTKYDNEGVEWTKKIEEAKEEIDKARTGSSHIQKEILAIQKKESDGQLKRIEIEQKLETIQQKISDVKSQLPHWQHRLKPLKLHEIPGETEPLEPLKTYTEDELNTYKLQDLQYQISVQEEKLRSKKPNLSVIQDYMNKREAYLERVKILEDITNKRNEMRQLYDDVRKKRYTEFMQGFHIITKKLKEMYQMITQGGDAELELVDSMDPFTEGVSFSVRPPKKTWKNISNLSGGEKTLSSLALVFALHYYKPSPLYFMDEIDAALDFKNISIVAHYIKERTKNAQFIIISLRSNMFELCDYLVGIYKVEDCTNTITIENIPPNLLRAIASGRDIIATLSQATNLTQITSSADFEPFAGSTSISASFQDNTLSQPTAQRMEIELTGK